ESSWREGRARRRSGGRPGGVPPPAPLRLLLVIRRFAVLQLIHPPVDEIAGRFAGRRLGTTLFHIRDDSAQPLGPLDRFFGHGFFFFFFFVSRAISSCKRSAFAAQAMSTVDRAACTN